MVFCLFFRLRNGQCFIRDTFVIVHVKLWAFSPTWYTPLSQQKLNLFKHSSTKSCKHLEKSTCVWESDRACEGGPTFICCQTVFFTLIGTLDCLFFVLMEWVK